MCPVLRDSILARSLSTQITSLPRSAKTAPVTSPTYPVPTTQMFMAQLSQGPQNTKRHADPLIPPSLAPGPGGRGADQPSPRRAPRPQDLPSPRLVTLGSSALGRPSSRTAGPVSARAASTAIEQARASGGIPDPRGPVRQQVRK